ncbi:MAG: protein kinase [Kofleriaceae bacterium]
MPCLEDREVVDYLDANLPPSSVSAVRAHLDQCSACTTLVEQLVAPSGREIDGMTLGRTIASGGMGVIVEARDIKLDRRIALKLPRTADPQLQRRFDREVKITARLQHPAIVPVYAAGALDDGTPYYAMRLVDGQSLDRAIHGTSGVEERLGLVRVVATVAGAIAYAHSQSIIHRDIKPANVLVGAFGEVVVIDWGLARSLRDSSPDGELAVIGSGPATAGESTATIDGSVVGTPAFMAPEQARGEPLDERADVYSLGAMLYHVLSGRPPGPGAPGDLAAAEPALPSDLVTIVAKAMAAEAAARYPTAKELADDLERFQTGRLVGVHRYSIWQLTRRWVAKHRAVVAVATLLSIALAVTGVIASRRIGTAEQTATTQRDASHDLVGYMLADLQKRLTAIGKLEILEGIGTKIDSYYTALGTSLEALSPTELGQWSSSLDVLGDVAYQSNDLTKAKAFYDRALTVRSSLSNHGALRTDVLGQLATSHAKLAKIQRETGDAAAAINSYEASRAAFAELATLRPGDIESQVSVIDANIQIGLVQVFNANAAARTVLDAALADASTLLASAPNNLRLMSVKLAALSASSAAAEHAGDLERAQRTASEGVAIAEAILELDNAPNNRLNLSTLVQRVGAVAETRGEHELALASFQRSASLLDELVAHDPRNAMWKGALAVALARVGDAQRALGHREQTTAALERSLALYKELTQSDPKNLTWTWELAGAYDSLATTDFDLGELARAEQRYRTGLELAEKLVAADPNSQEYRHRLYTSLASMGQITHARGNLDAALKWFQRRLEVATAMVDAERSNATLFSLSNAHEEMSVILMDRGDAAGARTAAESSLAIREQLVAQEPANAKWSGALANSLEMLAQSQDEPSKVRPLIARAIEHRRKMTAPTDIASQVNLLLSLMVEARVTHELRDLRAAEASQTEAAAIAQSLLNTDPKSALFATYVEQSLEIGGDIAAARQQRSRAAHQYRAAIAALAPFVDAKLSDSHTASEIAEAKWKLSKVAPRAQRGKLVREAIAMLETLKRSNRLGHHREKLLNEIRR